MNRMRVRLLVEIDVDLEPVAHSLQVGPAITEPTFDDRLNTVRANIPGSLSRAVKQFFSNMPAIQEVGVTSIPSTLTRDILT